MALLHSSFTKTSADFPRTKSHFFLQNNQVLLRTCIIFYFRIQELGEGKANLIEKSQNHADIKQALLNQIIEIEKSSQIIEKESKGIRHTIVVLNDSYSSEHYNLKSQIVIKETALRALMQFISKEENELKTLKQVNLLFTE